MSYLLHENHQGTVDLDGHHAGQGGQWDVGEDRDQGEVRDREEQTEDTAEEAGGGCRGVPEDKLRGPLLQSSRSKLSRTDHSSNTSLYYRILKLFK